MQKRATSVAVPAVLFMSFATSFVLAPPASADLTGAQVLQRCERAYKSLKSYSGTTRVLTKAAINGTNATYNTMATIQFVRPGKIKVEGTLMTAGRFAFISNGTDTWQTSFMSGGRWERAQSTEMAIAAFTGVSQNAATTIPGILLNTRWGNPFGSLKPTKVKRENVNKRVVYRIDASDATGPTTLWIDGKTFLLVRIQRRPDLSNLRGHGGGSLPAGMPASGTMDVTETFTDVRINPTIATSVFARPAAE
jgi:outer membrane lipoprotein-sorting protein